LRVGVRGLVDDELALVVVVAHARILLLRELLVGLSHAGAEGVAHEARLAREPLEERLVAAASAEHGVHHRVRQGLGGGLGGLVALRHREPLPHGEHGEDRRAAGASNQRLLWIRSHDGLGRHAVEGSDGAEAVARTDEVGRHGPDVSAAWARGGKKSW